MFKKLFSSKPRRVIFSFIFAFLAAAVLIVISYPLIPAPKVRSEIAESGARQISYNAPIKITFSQPMDKSTVEDAFLIEPQKEGRIEWDKTSLKFFPEQQFKIGEEYKVTIQPEAKSLFGKNLTQAYIEHFKIVDSPKVVLFTPGEDTAVSTDQKITVMFDRPMIALSTLDEGANQAIDIQFEPQIKGKFKWLGTTSFQFIPENLQYATEYQITIPQNTESAAGGLTDQDFVFKFSTQEPRVLSSLPENGSIYGGPDTKIELAFNQKIDKNSLKEHLKVYQYIGNREEMEKLWSVAGVNSEAEQMKTLMNERGNWRNLDGEIEYKKADQETEKAETEKTAIFTPRKQLAFDSYFWAEVTNGVTGLEGSLPMINDFRFLFKTVGEPKVISFYPESGNQNYPQYHIELRFSNPMNLDSLREHLEINPVKTEKDKLDLYLDQNGTVLTYYFDYEPSTEYNFKLTKGVKDSFGQELKEDFSLNFKTAQATPYYKLLTRGDINIIDANHAPVFYVETRNISKVNLKLKKLKEEELISLYETGYLQLWNYNPFLETEDYLNLEKEITGELNQIVATPINLNEEFKENYEPGIYYVELTSDGNPNIYQNRPNAIFAITPYSLALKQSKGNLLLWATSLKNGMPVDDMDVSIYKMPGKEQAFSGKTDNRGLLEFNTTEAENDQDYPYYLVSGHKDDQMTLLLSDWSDGIYPWEFNIDYSFEPRKYFAHIYTERPIYRPNQTVYFKGVIRAAENYKLKIAEAREINIEARDSLDKEIFKGKLPINENGTFNGSFNLAEEAATGQYTIRAFFDNEANQHDSTFLQSFWVAEYRRPDFKVDLKNDKSDYINGEEAKIEILSEYYFGAPMSNANFSYAITSQDYYFNEFEGKWYSFSNEGFYCYWGCEGGSEIVTEGKGHLDQNGNATVIVPLEIMEKQTSQFYTVEVVVDDLNNQSVANRITIPVHKGEYYVGIRSEDYVTKINEQANFEIISVDFNGNPIGDKQVEVTFFKREWNTVKKKNVDGSYYYENTYDDKELERKVGKTNEKGEAEISFIPQQGGLYRAVAQSRDARGNLVKAGTDLYVSTSDFINWGRDNNDRIDLVADKNEYKIGETAKLLIQSPYSGVKALLTYERNNVTHKDLINIDSNSQILEIPITEDFLPNTYVSVLLVKGGGEDINYKKTYFEKSIEENKLKIANAENELKQVEEALANSGVGVKTAQLRLQKFRLEKLIKDISEENIKLEEDLKALPEKDKTQNGDDANIASFKLGYATLRVDNSLKHLGIEIEPDKETYKAGDEVTLNLKSFDSKGIPRAAELSLSIVDKSVLALTDSTIADLVKLFYDKRMLGVITSHTLTKSLARINVQASNGSKGGGGGSILTRGDFKDLAFFKADIQTNEQGIATVKFKLPDNLTTWQALAIGVTKDTLLGSKSKEFKTTQELLVRPSLPRFLITNDKLKIGAIVHNNLAENIKGKIRLEAKGVKILEQQTKNIEVEAGKTSKIEWEVEVESENEAFFSFFVESGAKGDKVEITLPVHPYSFPEVVSTSGVITENQGLVERVRIPENIDQNLGGLEIEASPTLASNIAEGLEYLVQYPYGCTEQTASSLLPNLIVKQVLDLPSLSNDFIDLEDLKKKAESGLARLYSYQQGNGGFGIWQDSETTLHLTSYILYVFHQAKAAGYRVDENAINQAVSYIKNHINQISLDSTRYEANNRAYSLYVLSEIGQSDLGLTNNLYDNKQRLNLSGKAYLAMTYANIAKIDSGANVVMLARIKTLTEEILSKQKASPRGVHFEEDHIDFYSFDSNAKTTAIILQMLNRVDSGNPVTAKILSHLLQERDRDSFRSTQEVVHNLIALIEFLKISKELTPDLTAAITLNQEKLAEAHFTEETLNSKLSAAEALSNLLLETQENEIKITHEGTGNLYYDMELKYYLPTEITPERSEGLTVHQEYFALDDEKEENPLTQFVSGENYKVKITVLTPEDRYYIAVDDALPSGMEAIDFNLKTSSQIVKLKEEQADSEMTGEQNKEFDYWGYENYDFFNHKEFRDDRAVFFADFLPKGVYEIEYFVRATGEGTFHDLPTIGFEMYYPEVFGRNRGRMVEIGK